MTACVVKMCKLETDVNAKRWSSYLIPSVFWPVCLPFTAAGARHRVNARI